MSSANAKLREAKAAQRREYHEAKVDAAGDSMRQQLWAYCGWIVSELKWWPVEKRDEVVEMFARVARELNQGDQDDNE